MTVSSRGRRDRSGDAGGRRARERRPTRCGSHPGFIYELSRGYGEVKVSGRGPSAAFQVPATNVFENSAASLRSLRVSPVMEAGEDGFRGEIFRYEQVSVARLDREPVVFETLSVLARGKRSPRSHCAPVGWP